MSQPLMIERKLFSPNGTPGFDLHGSDRNKMAAFWFISTAYAEAELVVELTMLRGSQDDISPELEVIRRRASELAGFGLPEDDLAYVLMCLQGISQRRAYLWTYPHAAGGADDDQAGFENW